MTDLIDHLVVTPEQAAQIIDFTRTIEGLRWDFHKRIEYGKQEYAELREHINAFLGPKLNVSASQITYFGLNLSVNKTYNKDKLEVYVDYADKTGAEIVKEGFFFANADGPSRRPYSLAAEHVKLSGTNYWSDEPQKEYELIVHEQPKSLEIQNKLVELLKKNGYMK